jgi:hypothetical protein
LKVVLFTTTYGLKVMQIIIRIYITLKDIPN